MIADEVQAQNNTPYRRKKSGSCALCTRDTDLTFHHLIPRKLHSRRYFRKHYSRAELNQGIDICRKCHNGLHRLFDETTLGRELNSLQSLISNERVRKHCAWVRRQK